jgi:hypothetical protein
LADFSHSPSRRLAKAYVRRDPSSDSLAACNSMRICELQIFAWLALACIPMDRGATAEDRWSQATTTDKPAFVFWGVGYFHRWSQNDQHEFTPTAQDDLEKWSDMVTINVYPSAHDGDALAVKANAVLEITKATAAGCSELIPSLARKIGPQSISSLLFWSAKFCRGGICPF